MGKAVKSFRGRSAIALALASAAAATLAGCASDAGLSNPFESSARVGGGGSDRTATGSIMPPADVGRGQSAGSGRDWQNQSWQNQGSSQYSSNAPVVSAAPAGRISSEPLAPVRPASPGSYAPYASAASAPVVRETPMRQTSMRQTSAPSYRTYASAGDVPAATHSGAAVKTAHGVWSADGGSMVTVHQGENAATIATRYNVPLDVFMRVNGFVSAAQARPGSRVVIPVYSASAGVPSHTAMGEPGRAPGRIQSAEAAPSRSVSLANRRVADAGGRETMHFIKGPTGAPPSMTDKQARAADARLAKAEARGAKSAHMDVAQADTPVRSSAPKALAPKSAAPSHDVDHTSTASLPPENVEAATGAHDAFRWPVRGRIIQGFKQGANEGINIAVPDGTNVKAADDGVVAYAGNELKGYGNLVLIRHPNGFVTAYANNGELDVKRGETVKRGQVIAKSGASGNVSSPQLHFELRKGQTPVDPSSFLAGT